MLPLRLLHRLRSGLTRRSTAVSPVDASRAAPTAEAAPAPAPVEKPAEEEPGKPIRGAGAAIARNMEASLTVPTATSFRNVPAKLLEVNRKVINGFRSRSGQTKISFTHLIGWAIVRAIADAVPAMKNSYAVGDDGKPRLIVHDHVNMSLAVDVQKKDGSRTLLVPVLRDCDTNDFMGFLAAYEEIIRKVKSNKLTVDDFQGANISLTNPGGIGTVQSVPRLMPGQGLIVGCRQHRLPGRIRRLRPPQPELARRQQGRHRHQHLRPSHHPGSRVGSLPQACPRTPPR